MLLWRGMRLMVNLVTVDADGSRPRLRLIRAGEEIDPEQIPENARRFACSDLLPQTPAERIAHERDGLDC